ncbi:MAG TPA: flagellar hook-length control protein FliK [Candidatus Acidoferrales bacterium]|nr:flagellar hook-length control protein FliK [Candidatus Acidoferrales bacterium]
MQSQAMSSYVDPAQNPSMAISTMKSQCTNNTVGDGSPSDQPFAKLLDNLLIGTSGCPMGVMNGKSRPGEYANVFPHNGSLTSESENPRNEKTNNTDYSELASLILGIFSAESPAQVACKPDVGTGNDKSDSPESFKVTAKIEQQLAALLTSSRGYLDDNSASSSSRFSGISFMSMLSKKAGENPVMKESLLKILSDSLNSSVNKKSSNELEEILADLSRSGSQPNKGNPQTVSSRTVAEITPQAFRVLQTSTKNGITQAKDAQPSQSSTGKIPAAEIPSALVGKDLSNASALQPAVKSSEEAGKPSIDRDNQTGIKVENISANPDKSPSKVSPDAERQGSSKDSFADLTKHDGTDIYAGISTDPKNDVRFKQDFSSAVEESRDAAPSKPDISQVAQNIIREAKMMVQENKTVVSVRLEPESLGSVVLRVASDNGKISAEFNVRTSDARTYLESSIPQMREMLNSNGVSLSHLSVNLTGGESQRQQQQSRKNPQKFSAEGNSVEAARSFGYNTIEVKV